MALELRTTRSFDRSFQRLPKEIREQTMAKLRLFQQDPSHPSLRVKRIRGTGRIWEMSITMNYRVTFELDEERGLLRRIGTRDVLRQPRSKMRRGATGIGQRHLQRRQPRSLRH